MAGIFQYDTHSTRDFHLGYNIKYNCQALIAKAKLKSLPYNHTDHPPTHQELSIKSKQVYTSPILKCDTSLES